MLEEDNQSKDLTMAKQFKQQPLKGFQQAKTDSFNKNIESSLSEFNGKLNGNNLPVDSINTSKLKNPSIPEPDFSGSGVVRKSSRVPSQAYHYSQKFGWDTGNIWTPELTINLASTNWRRGWNKLEDFGNFNDFPLVFNSVEGMLVGCAVIDWHHGVNRIAYGSQPVIRQFLGYDWATQWGVFVNNVEVARTGTIYPRRHTTQIPFSVPCGSGPIKIDLRFIAETSRDVAGNFPGDPTTVFDIFGAEIWCRNVIR